MRDQAGAGRLAEEVTRCYDADCPQSARCARWLHRYEITPRTPSVDSLFPFDRLSVVYDTCPSFLELI
ncbi:hypothetical protein [Endozoicomonas sp. 4G]|uniref:hypothetical protein n=1 Tax=Endozoicomonas sp. 4G TaxID=2872754 RepID=UPI002078D105|nr:hypothetical protein [Endozoicomonas sp. 4G]